MTSLSLSKCLSTEELRPELHLKEKKKDLIWLQSKEYLEWSRNRSREIHLMAIAIGQMPEGSRIDYDGESRNEDNLL